MKSLVGFGAEPQAGVWGKAPIVPNDKEKTKAQSRLRSSLRLKRVESAKQTSTTNPKSNLQTQLSGRAARPPGFLHAVRTLRTKKPDGCPVFQRNTEFRLSLLV